MPFEPPAIFDFYIAIWSLLAAEGGDMSMGEELICDYGPAVRAAKTPKWLRPIIIRLQKLKGNNMSAYMLNLQASGVTTAYDY